MILKINHPMKKDMAKKIASRLKLVLQDLSERSVKRKLEKAFKTLENQGHTWE